MRGGRSVGPGAGTALVVGTGGAGSGADGACVEGVCVV